ncbi:Uncharacterised protein [Mycoplasmopsis synoviae]|uniref:Uncharacterized protein n=1 Tax=Mycoplasmopsis synoviae TaxID=2109 RepID=A0A3B0PDM6_MYCSY|nr:Uncharacterised protein [Mycoplasmopsis synoviae]
MKLFRISFSIFLGNKKLEFSAKYFFSHGENSLILKK